MDVDLRPVKKLRGSAAARSVLGPIMEAVCASPADLSRLRVACDWIQYKQNFREAVMSRPVADTDLEIAFDLRRCSDIDLDAHVKQALDDRSGLVLEPWVPGRDSLIWRFNQLYWQALSHWEQHTGREYEQSLPGGESDARNTEAARELILELFRIWDELDARRALPEELYILELGVGNGSQARTWLDEFVQLDRRHGREYYHRLRYLMGDYSPHVLDRARQAVAHHGERVSALVVEATRPAVTLGFLAQKAFLVYISNVYDNLPTDELASIHGRTYQVETQAFLTEDDAEAIAARFSAGRDDLVTLIDRLLRLGPELLSEATPDQFADPGQAVAFWRAAWGALRLRERYVPLEGLDSYRVAPSLTGEILRPLVEGHGDVRMHVSNGALGSFTGTLPLLHPFGRVQCHDLFLTGSQQYRTGFYGPGKYDGSVVNWVNGPLLQLVASRRGFGVEFTPFLARIPGVHIPQRAKTDYFDYYDAEVTRPLPELPAEPGAGLGLADDFRFTRQLTNKPIKFSFTGPFSLSRRIRDQAYAEPGELVRALAHRLNAEARDLAAAGAELLQIDEPFLAGYPERVELAIEAVNIVTEDVPVTWALHVCYGNRYARPSWEGHYDFLFPAVKAARVDQVVLEFARKGLDDLRLIRQHGWDKWLGLGVIDVKNPEVEAAELVASRIRRALEYVPPDRLMVNPDCGLRHLAPEVARQKLRAMVAGVALVRDELTEGGGT